MTTQIQNPSLSGRIPGKKKVSEQAAARFVRRMGIRPNLSGYRYLIAAIEMVLNRPSLTDSMTHGLYPAVAQCYAVTPCSVERNIRKAIELAYDNDPHRLRSMFYYRVGKPSVSEVVALALDTIQPRAMLFPARETESDTPHEALYS